MKNLNRTLNGSQCYTSFAPSKKLACAKVKVFQFLEVEFPASIKNFFIVCKVAWSSLCSFKSTFFGKLYIFYSNVTKKITRLIKKRFSLGLHFSHKQNTSSKYNRRMGKIPLSTYIGSVALLWHNAKVLALLKVKCKIH